MKYIKTNYQSNVTVVFDGYHNEAGLHLQEAGIFIINCPDDAKSTIAETALENAHKNLEPVVVVTDGTDITVMLFITGKRN